MVMPRSAKIMDRLRLARHQIQNTGYGTQAFPLVQAGFGPLVDPEKFPAEHDRSADKA